MFPSHDRGGDFKFVLVMPDLASHDLIQKGRDLAKNIGATCVNINRTLSKSHEILLQNGVKERSMVKIKVKPASDIFDSPIEAMAKDIRRAFKIQKRARNAKWHVHEIHFARELRSLGFRWSLVGRVFGVKQDAMAAAVRKRSTKKEWDDLIAATPSSGDSMSISDMESLVAKIVATGELLSHHRRSDNAATTGKSKDVRGVIGVPRPSPKFKPEPEPAQESKDDGLLDEVIRLEERLAESEAKSAALLRDWERGRQNLDDLALKTKKLWDKIAELESGQAENKKHVSEAFSYIDSALVVGDQPAPGGNVITAEELREAKIKAFKLAFVLAKNGFDGDIESVIDLM